MQKVLEETVKAEVKKLLNHHNYFWFMPPANAYGKSGIADFLALRGGVFLAVETKGTKEGAKTPGKPTPMQVAFLNSINAEAGFGFVVNNLTIPIFRSWLEAFDRSVEAASKNMKPVDEDGAMMLDAIVAMTADL